MRRKLPSRLSAARRYRGRCAWRDWRRRELHPQSLLRSRCLASGEQREDEADAGGDACRLQRVAANVSGELVVLVLRERLRLIDGIADPFARGVGCVAWLAVDGAGGRRSGARAVGAVLLAHDDPSLGLGASARG